MNGLGKKIKRESIFSYIKQNKESIFLLQETFSTPNIEEKWNLELTEGTLIYNHGTTRSRGVLIYIPKNINQKRGAVNL